MRRLDLIVNAGASYRGVALNDSDSMISLADVIVDGRIAPQAPGETPIELYKRAAELGNQNGERGYKALVAKAQWDIVLGLIAFLAVTTALSTIIGLSIFVF
jgi:hypothetical protein